MPDVLTVVIPILTALAGGYVGHFFGVRKDREAERRTKQLQFLIDAYRRIAGNVNRDEYDKNALEDAITDIFLFGTPRQIQLVKKIVDRMRKENVGNFDELLIELRDDLRAELKLEKVTGPLPIFRLNSGKYPVPRTK